MAKIGRGGEEPLDSVPGEDKKGGCGERSFARHPKCGTSLAKKTRGRGCAITIAKQNDTNTHGQEKAKGGERKKEQLWGLKKGHEDR